jgi:hypothetical protein
VRPECLKRCKRAYKPPPFAGGPKRTHTQARVRHTKLWIVNLSEYFVPQSEIKRYEQGEAKAEKLVKDEPRATTDSFHWPYKPRMVANELEPRDWVIMLMTHKDQGRTVYAPGQLLFIDHYVRDRDSDKKRWVFILRFRGAVNEWNGRSSVVPLVRPPGEVD